LADPSLVRFRNVVRRALAELESRRQEVNDLNVFPVADGDTGDNMALTLHAVLDELDRLSGNGPLDEVDRDEIMDSVARAALPGAADRAYDSVREPAEGTILTVVREMAHRVASELAHMRQPRLQPGEIERQDVLIAEVLERALDAGQQSVRRGPELLPILREAGVVDAGGFGLTVIFAGVVAALRGTEAPELDHHAPARVTHPQHESSTYRYCTNFAVTGRGMDPSDWVERLESIGDSVLVVGDQRTLKVHVHTDEPERATALFVGVGSVSRLDVADMHEQVQQRTERLAEPSAVCGVVAVVAGEGMEELFTSLGATPLPGGPTLNPSTYELLAGIHDVPAEEVVVLPNSPNVRMAAERAAELSEKKVFVVPTRSQQAGLAAAVALDPTRDAETNGQAMLEALAPVRTGAVTEAARDDAEARPARFHRGDAVGFVEERIVAWGEPAETLEHVLGELGREAELVTLIAGHGAPLDGEAVTALVPAGVDVEYNWGGQPAYWWLIAAE
jgi:DAK2 domain fusion protein YloV